jgi:hypothetical protein
VQSRQEEKLAVRPDKALASRDPFADLPFSPRAAFIWDHTAHAITWMNGAARSKFRIDTEASRAVAPAGVTARLVQGFGAAQANGKASGSIRFKAGRYPAIPCTFELTDLASGHKGLIVSEAVPSPEPANVVRLPEPAKKKAASKPAGKRPAAPKRLPAPSKPTAGPVCQLTPEEMRAFKAIGRTVRRLAREKQRGAKASPVPAPLSARQPQQATPAAEVRATPDLFFSAFDLVLFLDRDFAISRTEGRPQQVGRRKSGLLGKPVATVLAPAEQTVFQRMVKKLNGVAKVCRDTLVLSGEAGGGVPCRAVLGRWPDTGAPYFLALLSLSLPARLKRLPDFPRIVRLAA